MNADQFEALLQKAMIVTPKAFQAGKLEPPVSIEELERVEVALGTRLAPSHSEFLTRFGGGYFGYAVIYSAAEQSEWYLLGLRQWGASVSSPFLAFSCDFCGNEFGFRIEHGACVGPVVLWNHETEQLDETQFFDVYEYMAHYALQA